MGLNKPWHIKNKVRQIRVDVRFLELIEKEYPHARNPERTRRIMDRLLGNESNKTNIKKTQ